MNCFRYIVIMAVTALAVAQTNQASMAAPQTSATGAHNLCQAILDNVARRRCFENATPSAAQRSPISPNSLEGWRFVHTPSPAGGDDAISIIRTADALRSDLDFAGLTVRCGQKDLEVLVVVIQPFPPRSRPRVTLGGPNSEIKLEASVIAPGAMVLLPAEAVALAKGPWQVLKELPIKVEQGETTIRGIIPLGGLGAALQTLTVNCLAR